MTNVIAAILYTVLVTNVTNVQVHENCAACELDPGHLVPVYVPPVPPLPRTIRRETTEILETSFIQFDWAPATNSITVRHDVAFHNRVVSRTVRKFKAKLITHEEEVR